MPHTMSSYLIKLLLYSSLIFKCSAECPFAKLEPSAYNLGDYFPRENFIPDLEYLPTPPPISAPANVITAYLQNAVNPAYSQVIDPAAYDQSNISFENAILKSYMSERKKKEKPKCSVPPSSCKDANYRYRSYDGSCNNLKYPGWGMSLSRYGRLMYPKYSDGRYAPATTLTGAVLPSARTLSLAVYGEDSRSDVYLTFAFMQFGQFLSHDISRFVAGGKAADCCSDPGNKMCYSVPLDPYGPMAYGGGKSCLGFARALSDQDTECPASGLPYAEKLSSTTAYLDMGGFYGENAKQNNKVREYYGGRMKSVILNNRHWLPTIPNIDGDCNDGYNVCYNIPDKRNEFMPTISVMHTIFLREHNRIAGALALLNPHWDDERLFQETRRINIAQFQKIIYYDWLPKLIGADFMFSQGLIHYVQNDEYVNDYDPYVNPAALAEFATAAFRYGHTLIPGWFALVSPSRVYNSTWRLSNHMARPSDMGFIVDNFNAVLCGMVTQPQKQPDANVDPEIKHYFNRKDNDQYGGDLKSFDIQRSRDYGLPSYNDFREFCGLPRAVYWTDFYNEIPLEKIEVLQSLYRSPDDVEISIGGSLEKHLPYAQVGPTFRCIIGKQFSITRRADRFFFEHEDPVSGFTREQLAEIRKSTLSGIFCINEYDIQAMQPDAFVVPNPNNCLHSCNAIPQIDLTKWKEVFY